VKARWKFWLITISTVLAVLSTLALGRWQLSRASQKIAIQASIEHQSALPALTGPMLLALADPAIEINRSVTLRGQWLTQHTVFLDNRQMNNKPGLYVLTPLKLEGSTAVVLVQRGWVARNFIDRAQMPQIQSPAGVVEISGRLAPPPSKLYELGGPETGRLRQNLDMRAFGAELGVPLLPVSVQQLGAASDGVLREWPLASTGVDKHYGYAFQWFALSALLTLLYVWFQIVRRFITPRSH
jgi:surfeit locus 1 family protein